MLGSKNKTTEINAINVAHTILEKWCEKKYPGIFAIYTNLCESAHPNYEGLCFGYSYVNEKDYETVFENRWAELYADRLEELTLEFIKVFEEEYNNVWPAEFEKLENWLVINDQKLESEGTVFYNSIHADSKICHFSFPSFCVSPPVMRCVI